MVPMQFVFKLQCLQTGAAQAIEVLAFYKNTFLVRQHNLAALARCNIAHLAFKRFAAARAFFGFVLWHVLQVKRCAKIEHRWNAIESAYIVKFAIANVLDIPKHFEQAREFVFYVTTNQKIVGEKQICHLVPAYIPPVTHIFTGYTRIQPFAQLVSDSQVHIMSRPAQRVFVGGIVRF